jgi:hypothetical protein
MTPNNWGIVAVSTSLQNASWQPILKTESIFLLRKVPQRNQWRVFFKWLHNSLASVIFLECCQTSHGLLVTFVKTYIALLTTTAWWKPTNPEITNRKTKWKKGHYTMLVVAVMVYPIAVPNRLLYCTSPQITTCFGPAPTHNRETHKVLYTYT